MSSSSSGLPPSLNMLRIQVGEQEKSEMSFNKYRINKFIKGILSGRDFD